LLSNNLVVIVYRDITSFVDGTLKDDICSYHDEADELKSIKNISVKV
jgi:hypothetical protein